MGETLARLDEASFREAVATALGWLGTWVDPEERVVVGDSLEYLELIEVVEELAGSRVGATDGADPILVTFDDAYAYYATSYVESSDESRVD